MVYSHLIEYMHMKMFVIYFEVTNYMVHYLYMHNEFNALLAKF